MNIEEKVDRRKYWYDQAMKAGTLDREELFAKSDTLRSELEDQNVFCFDHPDGSHEVHYYPYDITRKEVENKMREDRRANAVFDGWLKSMAPKLNKIKAQ